MKKVISPKQLKELLDKDKAVVLDVRGPNAHESQHIEKSVQMSVSDIAQDKAPTGDKVRVIHCEADACTNKAYDDLMKENPSADVYVLEGGIQAWRKAGLPTVGSGQMSMMHQAYLVIGPTLLVGVILGAFVNPWFYLIPALVGLALIVAGLTRVCPICAILSLMPWNK